MRNQGWRAAGAGFLWETRAWTIPAFGCFLWSPHMSCGKETPLGRAWIGAGVDGHGARGAAMYTLTPTRGTPVVRRIDLPCAGAGFQAPPGHVQLRFRPLGD